MANYEPPTVDTVAQIKHYYHVYRHTEEIERKSLFFSPNCMQICRSTPSYAATSRDGIAQYLQDAQQGNIPVYAPASSPAVISDLSGDHMTGPGPGPRTTKLPKSRSVYTIRTLHQSEFEFGSDDVVAPIGYTVKQLKSKAIREEWIGMRVNLWEEGVERDLLVKVQYWWRLEEIPDHEQMGSHPLRRSWRQCLHDIIFIGPKDGTENEDRLEVFE